MEWVFVLVTGFVFSLLFIAPLSATIAKNKGLKTINWFLAGLFLGPFGLLAVSGMPDKKLRRQLREFLENQEDLLEEFLATPESEETEYNDSQEVENH